jgi:hypothetical protein
MSSTVAGARKHHVRSEPVTEDLRADALLGEGQGLSAVARSDGARDVDGRVGDGEHGGLVARVALGRLAAEAARQRRADVALEGEVDPRVLDLDDHLVEDAHEHVELEVAVGHALGAAAEVAGGLVAEEVRALHPGEPRLLPVGLDDVEDVLEAGDEVSVVPQASADGLLQGAGAQRRELRHLLHLAELVEQPLA